MAATYLKPDSAFWKLVNALPGGEDEPGFTSWTIEQVWAAAYPVFALATKERPWWLRWTLTDDLTYASDLIKTGGRMYYGP